MSKIINFGSKSKKYLPYITAVLVVILCIVAYVIFIVKPMKSSTDKSGATETSSLTQGNSKPTTQAVRENEVNDYLTKDDIGSAIKVLSDGVISTSNKQDQSVQYIRMAAMLYDYDPQGSKAEILSYAYKADELFPSARSATLIFDMETRYGNQEAAQKYLSIITERTKNDPKELE